MTIAETNLHGILKTQREYGCNTAVEELSIFVKNVLFELASELPSRVKDSCRYVGDY